MATKTQTILGIDTNSKTVKGVEKGFSTGIIYLAPSDASGVTNTCKNASRGCRANCLFTAGRGRMSNVKKARIQKTKNFIENQTEWLDQLKTELVKEDKKAKKNNLTFVGRLNGTSDINWEEYNIFQALPKTQFYDYTKSFSRMLQFLDGGMPKNYHLTFSKSETNDKLCSIILQRGGNVAAVFARYEDVIEAGFYEFDGIVYPVVDGDKNDLRFLDPKNCIIALKAKGEAKNDVSGFVIQ
jgi:hypothetical protein